MKKKITSLKHPTVKHLLSLRSKKIYRDNKKLLFVFGKKIVKDLEKRSLIKTYITSDENFSSDLPTIFVTEEIMRKVTNLKSPDSYAAEVFYPEMRVPEGDYILILDSIMDPGNLGTLIRSALALGWDGVIITKGSVDPFNDKAIRAAMGATFSIPIAILTKEEMKKFISGRESYLADINGRDVNSFSFSPPVSLILSNESKGADKALLKLTKGVGVPIKNMDSLNVSAAGSILLYLMRNR